MSIVVVGSVALDTVKSPFGQATDALGGSATYAAVAASAFTPVQLVGIVGEDFPAEGRAILEQRDIDLAGLEVVPGGKTFRWSGEYSADMNSRETLDLQLNVFADFHPVLPESFRNTRTVFLANIDPELQLEVLTQVQKPGLVVCDTMDLWIDTKRDALLELLKKVDVVILNDGEALQFSGAPNLVKAAAFIRTCGPGVVVIKKGEHGAMLFNQDEVFCAPALPLAEVFDPTGAGDSFAGGFVGYIEQAGLVNDEVLRKAVVFGSCTASFTCEAFSLDGLRNASLDAINERYGTFRKLTAF